MDLLVWVGWLVPAGLLAAAGSFHLASPRRLLRIIRTQHLVPPRLALGLTALLIAAELAVGAGTLWAGLTTGVDTQSRTALLATVAFMYAAFTLYLILLVRYRPGAACGCVHDERPANVWSIARAAVLAIAALSLGLVGGPSAGPVAFEFRDWVALLVSVTLAIILWQFPTALHDPLKFAEPGGSKTS
jgi:hypothetical protein